MNRATRRSILFLALAGILASAALPAPAAAEVLAPPVRTVVFYKHGMGYLERQGPVSGDATVTLSFRADQMKDLLTSFWAVDLGGGRITSIRYDAKEPASRQLQDILVSVPEQAALSQFLVQLKGARVSVKAGGETVEGRVLGIEPVQETVGGQTVTRGWRLVLLTDAGPARPVDLLSVSEFTLADDNLMRDLRRLLDLTLEGKHTNRKRLILSASGTGERELRLGYLVEMPVWKSSYRAIFDPKDPDAALLQGWALAENVTEEDWEGVSVSFVAGNPLSFVMDLYSPLYVKRPQVPVPGLTSLDVDWGTAPPPDLAVAARPAAAPLRAEMKRKSMAAQSLDAAPAPMLAEPGWAAAEAPLGEMIAAGAGPAAAGEKVGELFSYTARDPVTIPRGKGAMVPIVSERVRGKRVLYYKAAFSPRPVDAWVLRNDSALTFDAGAVTFFEGSASVGEGILGHTLAPGSQEVIPYAVDASADVTPEVRSERRPFFRGRVADGLLMLVAEESLTTSWKLANRGKEARTLWLDHPRRPGYRLQVPEKPLKEVADHYRFEVPLKGGETVDFKVEERREIQETVALFDGDEEAIRLYASAEYLSPAVRKFLARIGDLLAARSSLRRQVSEWEAQSQRLRDEQGRLRSNLNTNWTNQPKEQELRSRWMASLAAAEDRLAELRGKLDEAGERARAMEEELGAAVRGFTGE